MRRYCDLGGPSAITLRDYQAEMLQRLRDTWARRQSVMLQMPTGTGKTHLMAAVIRQWSEGAGDGGVLVVAHRMELIGQISQTLSAFGIGHGLVVSGKSTHERQPVQVASIQTLARRMDETVLNPSLVIVDEAHHALAKTYRMLWEKWPEARFLGLTATPCRLNGAAFTDLFDTLLQSWTIQAFIDKGWLSDFEYVSARPDSMAVHRVRSLARRGTDGDYQTKEMAMVMDVPESIAHLYASYDAYARGKKGIVYAIDRRHARHISDYYGAHGVRCCWIEARTPARERQQLVEAYRKGEVDVIVNVDIFSEGFDCPEVEFIQLARPTLSLSKYLQQVGRGMRISEGKQHVLILDQVGLYQTFGLPTDERDWQQTFSGRTAGKGMPAETRPVVIDGDARERELVNLEMVRIRRRSEPQEGLAIILQDGRYGVMKDGKVTCQPVFEQVRRIDGGRVFALATYPYCISRHGKTTVIDRQGTDMRAELYGKVTRNGEYFHASNLTGEDIIWDSVGFGYYRKQEPRFETVGGIEIRKDEASGLYGLRYTRGLQGFRFRKSDILYNQHIAVIRDVLVIRNEDGYRAYRIFAFMRDRILVCANKQYQSCEVFWDGSFGNIHEKSILLQLYNSANMAALKLKRA